MQKKSEQKFYIIIISTTTRTKETNYSAFERSGIGLLVWSGEPLSPRVPSLRIWIFRYRCFEGACSNNSIIFVSIAQGLIEEGYWVAFGETGFCQKGNFGKYNQLERKPHSSQHWREIHFCRAGACSNNRILLGFVAQGLVVEGYVLVSSCGLEKKATSIVDIHFMECRLKKWVSSAGEGDDRRYWKPEYLLKSSFDRGASSEVF